MVDDPNLMIRCEEDDPMRCQAVSRAQGQCRMLSFAGLARDGHLATAEEAEAAKTVHNCPIHAGGDRMEIAKKRAVHSLRVGIWQKRLDEHAEDENVKTLRGEIGALRMLLEEIIAKCETQNDLILHSHRISDIATRIEKLVTACSRLEINSGLMLDKAAILTLAGKIVDVVSRHVTDPSALEDISGNLLEALGEVTGTSE